MPFTNSSECQRDLMFLVLALPRSRTYWLSQFLSYRDYECGHEEARHLRSIADVKTWLNQDYCGSAETYVAPFWRLMHEANPNLRIVIVHRPVSECVESLMEIDFSGICTLDRGEIEKSMKRLDAKLHQIERRVPNVLSVKFSDLDNEPTIKAVFEHCLPYPFDRARWQNLKGQILTCNMRAIMRYAFAYHKPLAQMIATATHHMRMQMTAKPPLTSGGVTIQQESFDDWERDGAQLFEAHCVEAGGNWQNKNIPLMRRLYEVGAMQITTARCNGRMFGYLAAFITPSLESRNLVSSVHTTFYVSKDMPGLGLKLQRASVAALRERGVGEVVFHQGVRADGPRLGVLYNRMGAKEFGHLYRLQFNGA